MVYVFGMWHELRRYERSYRKMEGERMNMTINHFEIWRNKNGWIAVRESDDYTIKADTFSELIIKIDQTQQE